MSPPYITPPPPPNPFDDPPATEREVILETPLRRQTEHYPRPDYLRGSELERLGKALENLRRLTEGRTRCFICGPGR